MRLLFNISTYLDAGFLECNKTLITNFDYNGLSLVLYILITK